MVNIMAGVFYILGAAGYMTYAVKYLETQFQISASRANIIAGIVVQLFTSLWTFKIFSEILTMVRHISNHLLHGLRPPSHVKNGKE
jgi:hypothetical protein